MAGKIGPHEGIEFALYDEGKKDLIYFNNDTAPDNFEEEVGKRQGMLLLTFSTSKYLEHYICYPHEYRDKATGLKELIEKNPSGPDDWISIDSEIGRLLGYSEEEISYYVEKNILRKKT